MTNTVNELIMRKSVRAFTDKEITNEAKKDILLSIINAPSAGNQQMYTVIDVEDESEKVKLSVLCDNQPFIAEAKWVLVFCADFNKWVRAFCNRKYNSDFSREMSRSVAEYLKDFM